MRGHKNLNNRIARAAAAGLLRRPQFRQFQPGGRRHGRRGQPCHFAGRQRRRPVCSAAQPACCATAGCAPLRVCWGFLPCSVHAFLTYMPSCAVFCNFGAVLSIHLQQAPSKTLRCSWHRNVVLKKQPRDVHCTPALTAANLCWVSATILKTKARPGALPAAANYPPDALAGEA